MKLEEIEKALSFLKDSHVVLKVYKSGYFQVILNTNSSSNVGYDVKFDSIYKRLEISAFRKNPWKSNDLFVLINDMTSKQCNYIKKHLIENYFEDLGYLI